MRISAHDLIAAENEGEASHSKQAASFQIIGIAATVENQAAQVQTPLLILHNDKDGAVDHTQGIEYYNTLRRLNKQVVMLEYKGENHGLFIEDMKDYTVRMKEFFDYYLMDKPAPKWWTDGVPLLKINDELEARQKAAVAGSSMQQ